MQADTKKLSLCANQVREYAPDRFLQCLFVHPDIREKIYALYAFEAEVAHVRKAVTEEMIAYIRFAWWMESIDGLYEGKTRSHPVLAGLLSVIEKCELPSSLLQGIVEDYREAFPDLPPASPARMDAVVQTVLEKCSPASIKRWRKAGSIIAKHRAHYAGRARGWLALKLLLA